MTETFTYTGKGDYDAGAGSITLDIGGTSSSFTLDRGGASSLTASGTLGGTLSGLVVPAAVPLQLRAGAAAAAVAARFGASATEGLEVRVIDETSAALAAVSTDLTEDVPDGAVILAVQGNIETAAVAGGTSVKVGIGPVADPDKYGITSGLTQNLKIDIIPDWAVLSGAEDIQINACATGGGIGDTAFSAGVVRVRIVYLALNSLDNA